MVLIFLKSFIYDFASMTAKRNQGLMRQSCFYYILTI